MKSTLIELPPTFEESETNLQTIDLEDLEFLDELEVAPERRNRLLKPGSKFGNYTILGFVAAGGMGEVYAAERVMENGQKLGPVALKVMVPDYQDDWMITERFKREAKISRSIRSINVPRVYEFGQTEDGQLFIVMELLQGEELFDRLCTFYRFPEMMVAKTFLQILEGLRGIHESGFVHRDLKPENIYFHQGGDGEETIKILDFGIAKFIEEKSDPLLSVVGRIYGTPEYISPEQGLNPDVDSRSDLYSVGVMMYECLTGQLPFEGETPYVIILKHQTEKPPQLPSTTDPQLAKFIFKTLRKNADKRYQSATEMIVFLQDWIANKEQDRLGKRVRESSELIQTAGRTKHQTGGIRHKRQVMKSKDLPPMQIFARDDVTGEMTALMVPDYLIEERKAEKAKQRKAKQAAKGKKERLTVQSSKDQSIPTPETAKSNPSWLNGPSIVTAIAILAMILVALSTFL